MQNFDQDLHLAPPTNRGVVSAIQSSELSEFMLFDWLQFTILPLGQYCMPKYLDNKYINSDSYHNISDIYYSDEEANHSIYINSYSFIQFIFNYLFHVQSGDILSGIDSPVNGYEVCYSYRNIRVMQAPSRDDMGTHIIITGKGCRELEDIGINYNDLIHKLLKFNVHYSRIDVSYDVYHDRYFTLKKVEKCIKNIEVVTKFRSSIQFTKDNLISKENIGKTINFGSRASDIQFSFYDKLKERIYNANCEVDSNIKHWYRLECRFRNEKANKVIWNYIFSDNFNLYMKSIINNYISFKEYNPMQKQRCRWTNKSWWQDFLNTTDKIKFQNRPIEYSIVNKRKWLDRVASRSQLAVLLSTIQDLSLDTITTNYLYEYFKGSLDKLNEKDIEIINEYRVKNNLIPISYDEIKDYISDIKDILIQK